MFYVIEFQSEASTGAAIPFVFDNQADAEAKYHALLSVAAKSAVRKHGAMLITDNLFTVKHEVYPHKTEQTNEPE